MLILVGSPKKGGGVSQAVADHLGASIRSSGGEAEIVNVLGLLEEPSGIDRLISEWVSSDVVVLSFPLYVDSPPGGVIRMFELLAARKEGLEGKRSMLAIGNCGNPDPAKLDVSVAICRNFARHMGMHWLGGLRMPMGQAWEGRSITGSGRPGRHVRKALELTSAALVGGEEVPKAAFEDMSSRLMPEFLYIMRVNRDMKRRSKASGARMRMNDRPYGR